jgi:lysyl-tRNA synthetase class 2
MNLFGFFPGYEAHVYDAGREPAFMMLLAFILTLAGTRFYTRMARSRGWGSAHVGGVHVHHLVPGLVMSLIAGGLAIGIRHQPNELWIALLAIVFGAGAALVLDEFAMLLHLDDVYWTTEGRASIDACMAAVAFLALAILATFPLPTDAGNDRLARTLGDGLIALIAIFVVVTVLKGKLKFGLFGIVFAPFSIAGAIRLAKPTSIWARWLYPQGSWRLRRSEARFATREVRWTRRRDRFYDLIGGAPHLGSKRDSTPAPK